MNISRKNKHYDWRRGSIIHNCLSCGKQIKLTPARDKLGKGKFCSRGCYHFYIRSNEKISICPICKKEFKNNQNLTYCSIKCHAVQISGSGHPNWKGGLTPINTAIRESYKYKEWYQNIFIRDNFTCQKCGDKTGGNLNVHHIKRFSHLLEEAIRYMPLLSEYDAAMCYTPLWDTNNGITYCINCHKKEHKRHENYFNKYKNFKE